MSKWTIYNKNGVQKLQAVELEFHDAWMGEEFVTVNITSATPINLEIGDYLVYRGLTYTIYSLPTALKQARSGSHGDAFKYDGVKLSARSTELTEIRFLDIVLYDNGMHYTSLPTFSFYAETVDDLLDRIQANTDRNGETPWLVISYNYTRTVNRYPLNSPQRTAAIAVWKSVFGDTPSDNPTNAARDNEKKNVNISIDRQNVFDGLQHIKNSFGLNFITRERILIVGGEGISAEHLFKYGKGNGLYQIERNADTEQQIVTKLFAYGSDKNIPSLYYATIGASYFVNSLQPITTTINQQLVLVAFNADVDDEKYYTVPSSSSEEHRLITLKYGDNIVQGYFRGGRIIMVYNANEPSTRDYVEHDYAKAVAFANAVNGKSTVTITEGIDIYTWPADHVDFSSALLPNNMAVNCLMLPGFPTYSLYELCQYRIVNVEGGGKKTCYDIRKTPLSPWNTILEIEGEHPISFSTNRLIPFILSQNVLSLGTKEGDIHFTEENDDNGLEEVYPSVEGMTENDVFNNGSDARLDEIVACETITDDGRYRTDDPNYKFPNFHLTIPNLGFDLEKVAKDSGGDVTISLTDGYCGGRDFKVITITENNDHTWDLEVQRCPDDTLSLMFPYSDAAAHGQTPVANEPYQIRTGDHYVLTGINITETSYIWGASIHALIKAIKWLLNNDYTRFTYLPKVDEIYMARQNDLAAASQGTIKSLHDTLKAGMMMSFQDTDLNVDGNIFIDSLTIKENGNNGIPSYEVVLRNDKQVGSLQRVQNQINSLTSFVNGGGGGLTASQVRSLIATYGGEQFLSKLKGDVAQGLINFLKGISIASLYTIDSNGNAHLNDAVLHDLIIHAAEISGDIHSDNFMAGLAGWHIDRNGNIEAETLHLRSALEVDELRINRQQAQEGDTIFSDNDQIIAVEEHEDQTDHSISYILTLKEKWEGYFTAQQYGNIIRGKINTLAAKEADVWPDGVDYSDPQYASSQGTDAGGNKYYTSFMFVTATHNTDPSLGVNQIRVVLFGDNEVPMTRNYPPCPLMAIARWGCINYADPSDPHYEDTLSSIKRRQSLFMLSTSDGHIVKLTGVDKPILENYNYGTTLGTLPEFVKNIGNVREKYIEGRDYLYAQGVVVGDFIKVDISGAPVPELTFCGDWIDGKAEHDPITIAVWDEANQRWVQQVLTYPIPVSEYSNPNSHYIGYGIYLYNEYNPNSRRYETHQVRHNAGLWQCLQHQPVISGGVANTYPPKWNSSYWALVDGNDNLSIEFVSSKGYSFRHGYVDTLISSYLYYGNVDISNDIDAEYWNWTRHEQVNETTDPVTGETIITYTDDDRTWNAQHAGIRNIHLTNQDMPQSWSSANKIIFTLTVTINDGKTTRIVQNQVIS